MGAELGAEVHLELAPLKYAGLSYCEIWISEAQERMVLAVPPDQWPELQQLCAGEDVEATVLGEFKPTGRLTLLYQGQQVGDLDMHFLHDGRPPVVRKAIRRQLSVVSCQSSVVSRQDFGQLAKDILGSLNVCSKEWVIRQYDHEVQGGSVVKPLVGVRDDGPSDAAVIAPVLGSTRGIAIGCGINPRYGDLDPYWMAASVIDEAVRNVVAVGADPSRIALLDNFCWGNTDRPETLGSLVRAAEACRDVALAFGTPFISGKDSLNNEFHAGDLHITIPPTLLISALGIVPDVRRCVTMDLKKPGNHLCLLGVTKPELGGSHYHLLTGQTGGQVPTVDLELAPRLFKALHEAIRDGLIASCHDLSEGGLAVALAEMCFAGGLGARIVLPASTLTVAETLFAESNTRFLLEVPAAEAARVAERFQQAGCPCLALGTVESEPTLVMKSGSATILQASIAELKEAWQQPLRS
jgi:phosphoribosylformylglycinamidine synthase